MTRGLPVLLLALLGPSCGKVPIFNVDANFVVADVSWFAEEQTLFVFSEARAEQGLGEPSVIEVTYTTDDGVVDWTPLAELPSVHTHLSVDCGVNAICGSNSVFVPLEPRNVKIRLRYHRDGELALDANTVFNVVGPGAPHNSRSMVVYGVFDESNTFVQWRGRHQFPTIRNERAQALGLRRYFEVEDQRYGTAAFGTGRNPYAYGVDCPTAFEEAGLPLLATNERATFNEAPLPQDAAPESAVCASTTVTDALGTFTTVGIARKNPEVRPAFPLLRSPIGQATPIPFFLGPCDRTISADHEQMQRQRLQLGDLPTTCTDDWQNPRFVDSLVEMFRDAVEAERPKGNDMVLVIALHQDDEGMSEVLEEALVQVTPGERHRSSPRVAGAFVLDSTIRGLELDALSPVTLWCPSTIPLDELPDISSRSCAIAPDNINIELGPFSFGFLPILPSRVQYLDFIDTYSKGQAGSVEELTFFTPEFAATADHIDVGDFGVATFLNDETIAAEPEDAFSFCTDETLQPFVFRTELLQAVTEYPLGPDECDYLGLDPASCEAVAFGLLPLEVLPDWHNALGETDYELGLFWEFPFLLRMKYELVQAGAVQGFGLTVPFGFASPAQSYYGTELWTTDRLPLDELLTQCTRFCDHPTFDSAGVYHVVDLFRSTYANACYLPDIPQPGDSGFPVDP